MNGSLMERRGVKMKNFEKTALIMMSIALLVVASTNAYINCVQNKLIKDMARDVEILYAQVSTNNDRCLRGQTDVVDILFKHTEAIKGLYDAMGEYDG